MAKHGFIDLFAGAGGLSEGFIKAGFEPMAHVEKDKNACDTLKTRIAYHHLRPAGLGPYKSYLKGEISQADLLRHIPEHALSSVINEEISGRSISKIFSSIDSLVGSKQVDVVIGGPPCQAYSSVGRSRDPNGMRGDKRNYLFRYYAQFLERYQPQYFVFENVLGLLTAGSSKYFNEMRALFAEIGYSTDYSILNAEDYGVLQKRRRVIIIGRRGSQEFKFPGLRRIQNSWKVKKDLLYDLPPLKPGQELPVARYTNGINNYLKSTGIRNGFPFVTQHVTRMHNQRDLEIYSIAIKEWLVSEKRLKYDELPDRLRTHSNIESFLDRFKVIDPNGHAHTIVAHIAKDGHYYIYPDPKQVRSISVREAARLQSFPDDFYFEGGRTSAFAQIGNAVPPLMAYALGKSLRGLLRKKQ